jgi:hypothetical protein
MIFATIVAQLANITRSGSCNALSALDAYFISSPRAPQAPPEAVLKRSFAAKDATKSYENGNNIRVLCRITV